MGAINIRCTCKETRGSPKSDFLSLHRNLGILIVKFFLMRLTIKIQRSFIRKPDCDGVSLSTARKKELSKSVLEFYLRPIPEKVVRSEGQNARFCARYKPVMEIARTLYPPLLIEFKFPSSDFTDKYKRGGKIDPQ